MLDWLEIPDGSPEKRLDLREPKGRLRPAEELMVSGERLYYEGNFAMAAREFGRARRHDPTLFDAWAEEVDACLRAGMVPRAEEVADEAVDTYGKVPVFYAAKALLLAHQGYIEAAYQHSDISVEHDDARMFTWLARGEVVLATAMYGSMRSVDHCFERAAQLDPTRWRATFRAALALLRWGSADRAAERLRHVAERTPANPFVWKVLGDCHRELGDDAAARECYGVALSRRPDYDPAAEALRSMTLWGRLHDRLAQFFGRKRGQ